MKISDSIQQYSQINASRASAARRAQNNNKNDDQKSPPVNQTNSGEPPKHLPHVSSTLVSQYQKNNPNQSAKSTVVAANDRLQKSANDSIRGKYVGAQPPSSRAQKAIDAYTFHEMDSDKHVYTHMMGIDVYA